MIHTLVMRRAVGVAASACNSGIAAFSEGLPGTLFTPRSSTRCTISCSRSSSTLQQTIRKKQHNSIRKARSSRPRSGDDSIIELGSAKASELLNFQYAIEGQNTDKVLSMYPSLMKEGMLRPQDTVEIMRGLHNAVRVFPHVIAEADLLNFVQTFVSNYKRGYLPPHPRATLHVLGFYRSVGDIGSAVDFWKWLISQDGGYYLNLQTYGAAIEILAAAGQPLTQCEELFVQALKRFPNSFNEYLLSPGAVLSQPHLPIATAGTSTSLLQGITTARLLNGDWQNAYLALDTALKLHPTGIPAQFMKLFLDNRPIFESYQVFRIISQCGSKIRPSDISHLMKDLALMQTPDQPTRLGRQAAVAELSVIRLSIASGQELRHSHFCTLLTAALQVLPPVKKFDDDSQDPTSLLGAEFFESVSAIINLLDIKTDSHVYNLLISAAGRLRSRSLVRKLIAEFLASGHAIEWYIPGVLFSALSDTGDAKQIESTARVILHKRNEFLYNIAYWKALAEAAVRVKDPGVFYRLFGAHDFGSEGEIATMPSFMVDLMMKDSRRPKKVLTTPSTYDNAENARETKDFATKFLRELRALEISILDKSVTNIKQKQYQELSSWECSHTFADGWYESLYKDTNPTALSPAEMLPASAFTRTGFTLQEMRFETWKGITDLLLQADFFETQRLPSHNKTGQLSTISQQSYKCANKKKLRKQTEEQLLSYEKGATRSRAELETEDLWKSKVNGIRRVGTYLH